MDWHQFRTLLWLRQRLAINQWTRGSGIHAIAAVFIATLAVLAAIASLLAGVLAGAVGLARADAGTLLLVWDGVIGLFLFFWIMGIAIELQRSETIDLQRLLHLPISLRGAFVINFAASHFTTALVLAVPAMTGLIVGLAFTRGPEFALLALPVAGTLFFVTAWTYALRGWLAGWMANARGKRTVLVIVTFGIMLLAQAPALYFNLSRGEIIDSIKDSPTSADTVTRTSPLDRPGVRIAHTLLPPLWPGRAAAGLASGDSIPAILTGLAAILAGGIGLRTAYQSTLRSIQGRTSRLPPKPRITAATGTLRRLLVERDLPGVSGEVSAVAFATFRSMTRAPEVKMALGGSVLMILIFGSLMFSRGRLEVTALSQPWLATGAFFAGVLGMSQLFLNQFGFDRQGFRSFVLAPIPGRDLLLGRNLGGLPILGGFFLGILILLTFVVGLPAVTFLAGCCQLLSAFLLLCLAGNLASTLLPYRIAPGTMSPTKMKPGSMILLVLSGLMLPVILVPVAVPPALETLNVLLQWRPGLPVHLLTSATLLTVLVVIYILLLGPLGRLFDARKLRVLECVTRSVE